MAKCWSIQNMSMAQKAVLISLADQSNDDGVCWPSIKTIAKRTCMTDRSVRNATAWLISSGILVRDRRFNKSNVYTICPENFRPSELDKDVVQNPIEEFSSGGEEFNSGLDLNQFPTNRNRTVKEPSIGASVQTTTKAEHPPKDKPTKPKQDNTHKEEGFSEFWEAWPKSSRKQAKGYCLKAWVKTGAYKSKDAILAHIESLKGTDGWTKNNGEYIPAPLVYLNQQRWDGAEVEPEQTVMPGVINRYGPGFEGVL